MRRSYKSQRRWKRSRAAAVRSSSPASYCRCSQKLQPSGSMQFHDHRTGVCISPCKVSSRSASFDLWQPSFCSITVCSGCWNSKFTFSPYHNLELREIFSTHHNLQQLLDAKIAFFATLESVLDCVCLLSQYWPAAPTTIMYESHLAFCNVLRMVSGMASCCAAALNDECFSHIVHGLQ